MITVVIAAAALFISLGLRQGITWDLDQLVRAVGADTFSIALRDKVADDALLAAIAALPAVDAVGGSTAFTMLFSPRGELMLYLVGVTDNYFQLRNLPLAAGHGFEAGEAEPVAIIGHAVAAALFPDGDVVGQRIDYRGRSLHVIGLLAPFPAERGEGWRWGFDIAIGNPDNLVFLPHQVYAEIVTLPIAGLEEIGALTFLWAQAADGILRQAMDQVSTLLGGEEVAQVRPLAARYDGLFHTRRRIAATLTGIALLALLIGAINVANIIAASVIARRREIGIRRAVGAPSHRIAGLFLREALILTLSGGAVGALLGVICLPLIARLVGTTLRLGIFHLLYLGALVGAGLLAGLLPALIGARLDPVRAIAQRSLAGQRLFGLSLGRVMSGVGIAAGVGAVIMIVALGDTRERYLELRWLAPAQGVLRVRAGVGGFRQPAELTYDDFQALAALAGVDNAAWMATAGRMTVHSSTGRAGGYPAEVTAGIVDIGIGITEYGRSFTGEEIEEIRSVAVVGAQVARELFPDGDPDGREIRVAGKDIKVIGTLAHRPGRPPLDFLDINRTVFLPRGLIPLRTHPGRLWIWLKSAANRPSGEVIEQVRATLAARHPGRGEVEVLEPAVEMAALIAIQHSLTRAFTLMAVLGLLVAATGAGSTIWQSVNLKEKEIGIRKAVGACEALIFRRFVGEALRIALLAGLFGAAFGAGGAWLLERGAEVGVVYDPRWTILAVGLACLIGLLAGAIPAYRAARSDPVTAIRKGVG